MEWWKTGRALYVTQEEAQNLISRGRVNPFIAPPLGPSLIRPTIFAADPVSFQNARVLLIRPLIPFLQISILQKRFMRAQVSLIALHYPSRILQKD